MEVTSQCSTSRLVLLAGNSTRSPASSGQVALPAAASPDTAWCSPYSDRFWLAPAPGLACSPGLAHWVSIKEALRDWSSLKYTQHRHHSFLRRNVADHTLSGTHVVAVVVSPDAHQDLRPGGPISRCRGQRVALHGAGQRRRSVRRAGDARMGGARRALVEATTPCPRPRTCAMVVAVDGQEVVERAVSRGHVRGHGGIW